MNRTKIQASMAEIRNAHVDVQIEIDKLDSTSTPKKYIQAQEKIHQLAQRIQSSAKQIEHQTKA